MHFLNYYASFTAAEGVKLFASVEPVGRVVGVACRVGLDRYARRIVVRSLQRHALFCDDRTRRAESVADIVHPCLNALSGYIDMTRRVIHPPSAVVYLHEVAVKPLGMQIVVHSLDCVAVGFRYQSDVLRTGLTHPLRPVGAVLP